MPCFSPTEAQLIALAEAYSKLNPPKGNYLESDPVVICMKAVIDFRLTETVVIRAERHFAGEAMPDLRLRTLADLDRFFATHQDDMEAALLLWGYRLHTRAAILRRLVRYFLDWQSKFGLTDDISTLKHWAERADFGRHFEGKVKGLGIKGFQMMRQRLGVETAVPDSRVRAFVRAVLGFEPIDSCLVEVLNRVADRIGWSRTCLDWAIWEHDKTRPSEVQP